MRWDCEEPEEVTKGLSWGTTPTMRWVKRRVVIRSERYKDQHGNWQKYDVVDEQRVLQQAVKTMKMPGYKWVDVPEVEGGR